MKKEKENLVKSGGKKEKRKSRMNRLKFNFIKSGGGLFSERKKTSTFFYWQHSKH